MMRTANPALSEKTFDRFGHVGDGTTAQPLGPAMTLEGTATKTAMLLLLVTASAGWTWQKAMAALSPEMESWGDGFSAVAPWMWGGLIGGFVMALIISFKPTTAPMLAPVYALLEGLFLGAISAAFEVAYPGIVFQAVALTFGTLGTLLFAYRTGVIRATENFKLGVAAATGGILLVYAASWILGFFGIAMPFIHESGLIGIGFSVFVVVIAALNLVLDFDFIENGVEQGAPRFMEWYAAFGLLVTLVWLYIEILRLLSKLQSRD